jgi:hypothetical protein
MLWQDGWKLTPMDLYMAQHAEIITRDVWVMDGLGQQAPIADRLSCATDIILVDLPLWVHYWLAAERQIAWATGTLEQRPAGITQTPPTRDSFRTIWEVDQTWMPRIRAMCVDAELHGKAVSRLTSMEDLDAFFHTIA